MKGGSLKKTLNNLCHNQVVLYLVALLALYTVVSYVMKNNLAAIGLFLALSVLVARLTQNMIFVLLTTVVVTHLLIKAGLLKSLGFREGLKNEDEETDNENDEDESDDEGEGKDPADVHQKHGNASINNEVANQGTKPKVAKTKQPVVQADLLEVKGAPSADAPPKSKKKTTSGYANLDEDDDLAGTGNKVNYAATVENAFDNLEKILGSDGMKKMSDDTARLADKQQNLISAMKNMEPLMQNAQKMLNSLQGGPLANLLKGGSKDTNDA